MERFRFLGLRMSDESAISLDKKDMSYCPELGAKDEGEEREMEEEPVKNSGNSFKAQP